MSRTIALVGNPNSGKTTMFNHLTGSNQYVGNWPGVTVERKGGNFKEDDTVIIQDLPGIYSLSPYTLEEVVSRDYLLKDRPDVILNIVDATNLERNLYLTTQLLETGIPVAVALNMMDAVRKSGATIDASALSQELGCPVIETSALKGEGDVSAVQAALRLTGKDTGEPPHVFGGKTEHALAHIEDQIKSAVPAQQLRWYAVKVFERDEKVFQQLAFDAATQSRLEDIIVGGERELDDDAESIITNERYTYISALTRRVQQKRQHKNNLSPSDRIDQIMTNRWLALPIFAAVMFVVYFLSISTVGTLLTDFVNETVFGDWIIRGLSEWLPSVGVNNWMVGLITDGIIGGVGAVLGFVPQMLVLFFLLSVLEDIGYMARVAFIMDRIFRKFGLSGKSFIPMLIGSGCSVPGIMASRTIENECDRRMTIMTTAFIPCGAKMPIVGLIAGALFGGAVWVAPCAYFIGVAAVILSGILLKKFSAFSGEPAPFIMELPAYHIPSPANILRNTWDRGWSFIKRAGTIILLSSILIWFLKSFGFVQGRLGMVDNMDVSILAVVGGILAPIFRPIGFDSWQSAVATVMGLAAKEEVVSVFGVLFGLSGDAIEMVESGNLAGLAPITQHFTPLTGFTFMLFNLLCAPCFAAVGAIRREMNSSRWTWVTLGYMTVFAYCTSFIVFQLGTLIATGIFRMTSALALLLIAFLLWLLFRPGHDRRTRKTIPSDKV